MSSHQKAGPDGQIRLDRRPRAILARLARGDASVTELADPFDISLPAISKHLRVLEAAGLLARERDGRVHRCCLVAEPLREAAGWIGGYHRFWEKQFDALARYLDESKKGEAQRWPAPRPHSTSGGRSRPPREKVFRAWTELVYTWRWEAQPELGETLVTVEFLDRGGSTEVLLTHEFFPGAKALERHAKGWSGSLDPAGGLPIHRARTDKGLRSPV